MPNYIEMRLLLCKAILDIGNYFSGESEDLTNVKEFVGILKKYKSEDTETFPISGDFDHWILCRTMMKEWGEEKSTHVSQFHLEMSLLISELENINPSSDRKIISFLGDYVQELMRESLERNKKYLYG